MFRFFQCLRGFYQSKSLSKASAFANDNVLWTPSKIVTVGQKVWCYRHNYNEPIYNVDNIKRELKGERRTMFLATMRMILPPTLLFIAGFICLFFSCIYWQRYSWWHHAAINSVTCQLLKCHILRTNHKSWRSVWQAVCHCSMRRKDYFYIVFVCESESVSTQQ